MTKPDLSRYDRDVLRYMDDKMWSSGKNIGDAIGASHGFGTKVARQMMRRGLLVWLPDVGAWRISAAGREVLTKSNP